MTNSVDNEEIQEIKTLQDNIIIPDGNISKTFQLVMLLKEAFCCMMYYGLTESPLKYQHVASRSLVVRPA